MPSGPRPLEKQPSLWIYAVFAGALVLLSATEFYACMKQQLFYSLSRSDRYALPTDWSAPLDDVFIHFDFARSAARGHPFEWIAGNGYSSGGTSLLYPLVLAPGYALGFRGTRLMEFAAVIGMTCALSTLLSSRRLFRGLPPWTAYLAPPIFLSIGALDWSLWSGMEVAFFLAVWGVALVLWDDLVRGPPGFPESIPPHTRALGLGLANGVLVATRPEAFVVVVVFGLSAAWSVRARRGLRAAFVALCLTSGFAALVTVGSAVANRVLTGDWSAAGALVKLELYDPRLTAREVWDAWLFHVRYQIARVTGHHVAEGLVLGSLLWVLAALPFFFARTRRLGALLWAQALLWVLVVALNGQVRWQNERYTMPALAWLLLSAALGVGAALSHELGQRARWRRLLSTTLLASVIGVLAWSQVPRMRDQIWFFARASRNIRDQHVVAARRIRQEIPTAHRILVGDAGAIPYASDLPALDIIGLGGLSDLPFARASRWGVAASIELIERIPPADRPDLMAIYPGWWGDFPLWFGKALGGVSVRGNVICGGLTKMVYETRWAALDHGRAPSGPAFRRVADEVDPGDVVNEKSHRLRVDGAPGFVDMKLLPHPAEPTLELWDAGRVVPPGASLSFTTSANGTRSRRLVMRLAPAQPALLRVSVAGAPARELELRPTEGWSEQSVDLPPGSAGTVTVSAEKNEVILYHLWIVE